MMLKSSVYLYQAGTVNLLQLRITACEMIVADAIYSFEVASSGGS